MDVIAAIATAAAPSAIGVLRISGEGTARVLSALFVPKSGASAAALPSHHMVYGTVLDARGNPIDCALAVRFDAGHSYTGEESAEVHCHGSPVVLSEALSAAFAAGARQARAGEFTKRAFLNGKLDLTEAEAVIDLIDAETANAARNAAAQLSGALGREIRAVREALLSVTSRFYAVVDYPDEDIEDLTREETERALAFSEETLSRLLATASRGQVLKYGVKTAILGAPNAGKSSLLNRLVGYDRAIVTPVAGTTRDTVEEKAVVGGVLLRLTDTAGLRDTDDEVEKLGVERSRRAAEDADLLFLLIDASRPLSPGDEEALSLAQASGKPWILIYAKSDLPREKNLAAQSFGASASLFLSSRTGEGYDALEAAVASLFPQGFAGETLLTNPRQTDAAERALARVREALAALRGGMTPDVVLTEAEAALDVLGELTGETAREAIVSAIFDRFCVGK
ncbi:MAG: tRNA uridine-5-carboxymethylaminomethyl(34) synthesis GTPase MnmE [Oscillibacter sp.]|nr:tRNA uridine-5-carboxymethylaminomethyl(34) synthesis GTPase MnmE [Oscillibacter sp.]